MKLSQVCLILATWNSVLVYEVLAGPFGGAFLVNVKALELCRNQGTGEFKMGTRISKKSRTLYTYSSNVTFPYDFDHTVTGKVDLAVKGNGGYKAGFFKLDLKPLCEGLNRILPQLMDAVMTSSGHKNKCPYKKGVYDVRDVEMSFQTGVAVFPFGEYRFTLEGFKDGKLFGCFLAYVEVKAV